MHNNPDDALLEAICAAPEDDEPRLIYADFLEEAGDAVRAAWAEFIRVQCQLARLPEADGRRPALLQREAALLKTYRRDWNGFTHRRLQTGPLRGQVRARRGLVKGWQYRRGFIAEVKVNAVAVVLHSSELLLLGPLERLCVWGAPDSLGDILRAPVLHRLTELDLSGNLLGNSHVPQLLAITGLARLRSLDLRRNIFSPADCVRLNAARVFGPLPRMTLLDPQRQP